MKTPSGSNFWESNRGKGLIIGGTALCGGNQALRNMQETRHEKWVRSLKRIKGLKEGWINPSQYVLEASRDDLPSSHIKDDLLSWGGTWKGINFSNSKAFSVKDEWKISPNPARKLMRFRDLSCNLEKNPSNPTSEQGTNLGLRGGSTELMEVQEVTKNDIDMATGRYKYYPNLVSEVCAEQVQAVPDRSVTQTYSFRRPLTIHPIFYYLSSLGFICVSSFLVNYIQHKFSKRTILPDSASTMRSVEALERPSGEEEGSATKAKPEFVIETFLAYKRELISKKKAAYILVKYYNLSEVEALELLDD